MKYIIFAIVGLPWIGTLYMTVRQVEINVSIHKTRMDIIMSKSIEKGMVSQEAIAYYSKLIRRGYESYKADNGNSYLDYDKLEDKIFAKYYNEAYKHQK